MTILSTILKKGSNDVIITCYSRMLWEMVQSGFKVGGLVGVCWECGIVGERLAVHCGAGVVVWGRHLLAAVQRFASFRLGWTFCSIFILLNWIELN